ncbi:MAG TPA: glycosyltransferase family 39 protein [Arenimonas sp.]|uniref:ArnT family glycosyltransferase n=1 Tax=Arenimonas sp. TaxID=1872635 RepID=UPI002D7E765F|nr:glycosyltransferase family 39 protein [Arenimonas sp.]HEU0153440.1 glycosyltransferase family 39 protein [Arenimonas sp.]
MRRLLQRLSTPGATVALVALLLAFGLIGARAIWDPDEGRYTNVALTMLDTGNFVDLSRHHESGHWTKPPLTYWAIAASLATFGPTPAAARLTSALAFLACTWLAWRIARRLQPGSEATAALVFATMLLPFGAANLVTTDFLLAACQAVAMLGWVEARFGEPERRGRWLLLMWMGFAAGFMTKGPPAMLPLLAIAAMQWLAPAPRARRSRAAWAGVLVFALLALPWYLVVVLRHEGLLAYFLGTEVVARLASDKLHRNPEWYGWLLVYGPTLALGSLPWTGAFWRALRSGVGRLRAWRDAAVRQHEAPHLLLLAWLGLPLLVFCLARSRLPLYLLPLFVPIALLVARQRFLEGRALPRWRWLAVWVGLLLALRLATALWPSRHDASRWAEELTSRAQGPVDEVVFVEDTARYGLHLHMHTSVEKISVEAKPESAFGAEYDSDFAGELAERERAIWVTKAPLFPELRERARAIGFELQPLGEPYEGRIIFRARSLDDAGR